MRAIRAIRAPLDGTAEREAARVRFVADVDVAAAAAHASSTRRDALEWLATRAFATDASRGDWSRLHRAVARLLDDDRRPEPACERLRRFVSENDDLP